MASFYDAYKGNVGGVDVRLNTTGSAGKSFGDAFAAFGRTLRGVEAERAKQERYGLETQVLQESLADTQAKREQEQIDKALMNAFGEYQTPEAYKASVGGLELASPEVREKMDTYYQSRFNDEAVRTSVAGGYESFDAFKDANPDLVQNADGKTMTSIEKYFADKDKTMAALKAQEKETKHAKELLAMQAKVTKAQKASGSDAFKYTEQTDAKIAAQVKTAMGMDAPDFDFTDAKKKEYENSVAGAAKISKMYNLEPSLAIHVYMNPDLYDFTADGKVIARKVTKEPEEPKASSSWKDYAPEGLSY
jgi:hypothetical protein